MLQKYLKHLFLLTKPAMDALHVDNTFVLRRHREQILEPMAIKRLGDAIAHITPVLSAMKYMVRLTTIGGTDYKSPLHKTATSIDLIRHAQICRRRCILLSILCMDFNPEALHRRCLTPAH